MTDEQNDAPKIIVDDDWKKQAQADKQQLADQSKEESTPDPAEGPEGQGPDGEQRQIPQASFITLVSSIATQAMMALGGFKDPGSEKVMVDPELAKHHIDTLKVIGEKTKGNLNEEEAKLLEDASYQVQMLFVQVIQHISGQQPGQAPEQAPGQTPGA
ncbi:MAG: DUF1844 domain-containing protein [bacterium]|nr:DUF1844 domain-containing protein [bacterium]